eukprot:XP_001703278.1 predicted protein [Chlamydomonas reinhardtii]
MDTLEGFERRANPGDREQQELLSEMRGHLRKLQESTRDQDPRLSFSTPEFKEAQRAFTDGFKRNFGRPVEWAMVKEYPWSTPVLRKLEQPVDVKGQPWPAQ